MIRLTYERSLVLPLAILSGVLSLSGCASPNSPMTSTVAPLSNQRSAIINLSEPLIGNNGLLTVPSQPDAPTQVIDCYRVHEGRLNGDVVVWLQNTRPRSVRYVTYKLRIPVQLGGAGTDEGTLVG